MTFRIQQREFSLIIILVLLLLSMGMNVEAQLTLQRTEMNGPFIDRLELVRSESDDQQILALLNNEVDLVEGLIDPGYLDVLEESENVRVARILRSGYGRFVINCGKYPLNITAFRRAFAFALDKEAICQDAWEREAIPHDSIIPPSSPWTIERLLETTYYSASPDMGNQLLDDAGFLDIDADGWREAPDGSPFDVVFETCGTSNIGFEIIELAAVALGSLNIKATVNPCDFWCWPPHDGDFDLIFTGMSVCGDIRPFFENYASWMADVDYRNLGQFRNSTYDKLLTKLDQCVRYNEALELIHQLQEILHYECPVIVCYVNCNNVAHRKDRFEGFVYNSEGAANFWTVSNVRLRESAGGPYGGTLRWATYGNLHPSPFTLRSSSSSEMASIYWTTLMRKSPTGHLVPWLAESYFVTTREDHSQVPQGHMRITINLFRNITWNDGERFTAEDVAFSLNYYRDGAELGNPLSAGLEYLTAAYANGPFQVVVEFSRKSYWNLETLGYSIIIPKHVFAELGLEGFETWTPAMSNQYVPTTGPLIVKSRRDDSTIVLERNTAYFKSEPRPLAPESQTDFTQPTNATIFTYMPSVKLASSIGTISLVVVVIAIMCKGRPTKQKYVFD